MREAVHCIGTLLILSGCLGLTWMGLQLSQSIEAAFHGGSVKRVIAAQSERKAKAVAVRAPFVLMPEARSIQD